MVKSYTLVFQNPTVMPCGDVFGSLFEAEPQEMFGGSNTDPHQVFGRLGIVMTLFDHYPESRQDSGAATRVGGAQQISQLLVDLRATQPVLFLLRLGKNRVDQMEPP